MKPVFAAGQEGAQARHLLRGRGRARAARGAAVVDEGLAKPVLIGRPDVIGMRIEKAGLRIEAGRDFEVVNPDSDPRYKELWQDYHAHGRQGVTPGWAKQCCAPTPR
jgi:malate dehydrogenase (oxaloacetate-decarboxylating)(NADP+)